MARGRPGRRSCPGRWQGFESLGGLSQPGQYGLVGDGLQLRAGLQAVVAQGFVSFFGHVDGFRFSH